MKNRYSSYVILAIAGSLVFLGMIFQLVAQIG